MIFGLFYCAVQKNSVPAAAGAVAASHTVFLLNIVLGAFKLDNLQPVEEKTL